MKSRFKTPPRVLKRSCKDFQAVVVSLLNQQIEQEISGYETYQIPFSPRTVSGGIGRYLPCDLFYSLAVIFHSVTIDSWMKEIFKFSVSGPIASIFSQAVWFT